MKNKITFISLLSLLLLLNGCGQGNTPENLLANNNGKWIFINYWATWCKPCIKEIPELNDFAAQNPSVVVLGVNFDGIKNAELASAEKKLNIEFETLSQDPYQQLGYERPNVLPVTIVINPDGAVVEQLVGPQSFDSLMKAFN